MVYGLCEQMKHQEKIYKGRMILYTGAILNKTATTLFEFNMSSHETNRSSPNSVKLVLVLKI